MNELQIFKNSDFGQLEVLLLNEKEYFPATACAKMLGYANPQEAIRLHCKGVRKILTPSRGGQQEINHIPEADLYRLIIRSKLPAAEKFERWIMEEVLPAIRRQGAYAPDLSATITKAVTVAVCEAMKQLVPMVHQIVRELDEAESPTYEPGRSRRRKRTLCAIERLTPALRWEIDQMLASDRYSYLEIVHYLESHGIKLSQMAVCNYYNKMCFGDQ